MRFVAVRARDAIRGHAALQERAVDVHLAQDLPVGVVRAGVQLLRQVAVEEAPRRGDVVERGASRVARRADFELGRPVAAAQEALEPGGRVERSLAREAHVVLARAVAGFARDVDLLPSRLVRLRRRVEAFVQRGRVALGAHRVPSSGTRRSNATDRPAARGRPGRA